MGGGMNRRDFLKSSGAIAASSALPAATASPEPMTYFGFDLAKEGANFSTLVAWKIYSDGRVEMVYADEFYAR